MFDRYVLPTVPISKRASEVTGLTSDGQALYHLGRIVNAIHIKQALCELRDFLQDNNGEGRQCLLVAHNGNLFDSNVLMHHLVENKEVDNFNKVCAGFADSLPVSRALHPQRKEQKKTYQLSSLCRDLCNHQYDAHNAQNDVIALEKLCGTFTDQQILSTAIDIKYVANRILYNSNAQKCKQSFSRMEREKVISSCMAMKAARSGLKYEHLQLAFTRGGADGLRNLLTEKSGGKPRVTVQTIVLDRIISHFSL